MNSNRIAPIDHTHAPELRSWVESAAGHPAFPIQNLPLGVFRGDDGPRIGVAIGDQVLDLRAARAAGLLQGLDAAQAAAVEAPALNDWMALAPSQRRALRHAVSALLAADTSEGRAARGAQHPILRSQGDSEMLLPARVGDYTDFYAGIHHAINAGKFFRPDNPLLPNYKHVPVAYHGRASSVRPSGALLRRPRGQVRQDTPQGPQPVFQPSARLDYELELAIWIGPGNALGEPIAVTRAGDHVAGFGLLNDWSARDIQAWEYQPLGAFQGKNFLTSVSPWVVTADAMAPFRAPAMARDGGPRPLDYLYDEADQQTGGLRVELEVYLSTRTMRSQGLAPHRLSRGDSTYLWWTPAQMVAHHTVAGCDLQPGDLLGSGTISTPEPGGRGCLLELTDGVRQPVQLPGGETRMFLQDGDEVVLRGQCRREGFATIGLGECRGLVQD
ncbi:fumarylacetoacetase [Ramlibacter tataouinensis]|uniref:fumarylacetoacetase n=1 Tax=Ramlibacter tataouinensis TaxID=94132 RepID=UPI0022F3BE7F|nr:fumarylacetoacetase [Ramlibacter tataouinensis]WBY01509.1 fumarylacetoacetase [Ramlibacter tataouinensis]